MSEFWISNERTLFEDIKDLLIEGIGEYRLKVAWYSKGRELHIVVDGVHQPNIKSFYDMVRQHCKQKGYSVSSLEPYEDMEPNWKEYRETLKTDLIARGAKTLGNMTKSLETITKEINSKD